ncbi:MAG: LacI family DNA-binding transcriptional regulator [Ruminiclostridium sp.]
MPKKVTMDIIAKKLGISKNTVSLALRGFPGINEKTRRTIEATAYNMGYQYRPTTARVLATRNLCMVIAKSTRDSIGFFSYIQLGIEDEAKKNNVNTIIHYYDENDEIFEVPNCIKDGMVSGIITLGRISHKTINAIVTYGLPIVMVDNYFDDLVMDCILTDNQCGGYLATEHLIKYGHTKIGFLGDIFASVSFYDRHQGYLKALRAYKIELEQGYSITDTKLEKLASEDIANLINEIKVQEGLPTAYVCCNDAEAIVIIKVLKNMGILIPDEISIMGFDDIETARNVTPELTTMRVQKELMGKRAVCKLLEKIDGGDGLAEKILLSASLVKRESVKQNEVLD